MDLCLMIEGQEGVSWPQWVALARACEEHGVPALFRSDHYLELGGDHPERGALDAWTTLAALAAVTTTLRLGTMVSPASFRHPSVLAKAVVTADHVRTAGWNSASAPVGTSASTRPSASPLRPRASGWTCSRSSCR
jgi:hypothetical protein